MLLFTAIRSDDIPDIEVIGCPVTYDTMIESYWVEFQFMTPFSPAVLSHIDRFSVRVDSLQQLHPSDDFTIIDVGIIFDSITVSCTCTFIAGQKILCL